MESKLNLFYSMIESYGAAVIGMLAVAHVIMRSNPLQARHFPDRPGLPG